MEKQTPLQIVYRLEKKVIADAKGNIGLEFDEDEADYMALNSLGALLLARIIKRLENPPDAYLRGGSNGE